MTPHGPDPNSIFSEALERPSGPERAAVLDEAWRGNEVVRTKVDALVAAFDQAGRYLAERPRGRRPPTPDGTIPFPKTSPPQDMSIATTTTHPRPTQPTPTGPRKSPIRKRSPRRGRRPQRSSTARRPTSPANSSEVARSPGDTHCGKFSARAGWAPCIVLTRRSRSGGRWR